MAAKLEWLDQAKDDLREILDFIAKESPRAAADYVTELVTACDRLAEFPLSGRRYSDQFRVLVFRNHLVFYAYDDPKRVISIAMVVGGRRDISRLLDDVHRR
jgi:toxin ParE1/3/4